MVEQRICPWVDDDEREHSEGDENESFHGDG